MAILLVGVFELYGWFWGRILSNGSFAKRNRFWLWLWTYIAQDARLCAEGVVVSKGDVIE
jgi:hypothetical protein